jgi:5-methylcytosine-specific restriction endonuclease McrA
MPRWLDDMTNAGEPGIPQLLRDEVWERDEGQCTKCGTTEEVDAYCVVPYGMPTEKNTKLLCKACKRLL